MKLLTPWTPISVYNTFKDVDVIHPAGKIEEANKKYYYEQYPNCTAIG